MVAFRLLFDNGQDVRFLSVLVFLCAFACAQPAQQATRKVRVLAAHDYDPLTDSVVGWKLQPGESITQSFRLPEGAMRVTGFRVRLRRNGVPSPIHYQLRSELGGALLSSGVISLRKANPWFERWYGADFAKPVSAPAHRNYYLELRLPKSPSPDYFEVFGSAEKNIVDPRFLPRFRYVNTWGVKNLAATEFENSANLDYGVRTRSYADGTAYADGKSVLDGFDLAFEILGDGPAGTETQGDLCGACEERFAFTDDITGDLFRHVIRDQSAIRKAGEVELDGAWSIENLSADQEMVRIASVELRDFLKVIGVRSANPNSARKIRVGTKSELPAHAAGLSKSESFRLNIGNAVIVVCGYDARGAMRGLHHLEAMMRLRQAPILPVIDEAFAPAHSPRITSTPFYAKMEFQAAVDAYTDGLLARMSRAGFNAIWVWGDLDEIAHSSVYPELDQGVRDRQAKLRMLMRRTARYGMDVYLVLANKPLPESFYQKHPDVRGSELLAYGGTNILCTSTQQVRDHFAAATKDLMQRVPALKGFIAIVGGEGFMHCHMRRNTCPRCSKRSPQETIAEFSEALLRGARNGNPEAVAAFWPYSASNTWSKGDTTQSKLIERLPAGATLMTEFAKEGAISFGGTTIPAYDYTISFVGPSERFRTQAKLASTHGLGFWVKTEHAIALEMIQTPTIPVYFQWAERFKRIHQIPEVSGEFDNWMHYGFMPTIAADIYYWSHWEKPPDAEDLLRRIAQRDFGAGAAEAIAGWRDLSAAIQQYPFSGGMAMGPIQKGPSHPLFLQSSYKPLHGRGRQFTNDLNWTRPWGPDLALSQLEKLEAGWSSGITHLRKAAAEAPADRRRTATREEGLAEALLYCIRSTINVGRFYQARELFENATDQDRAAEALDKLIRIAKAERENAKAALPFVCADSRIGFANSGQMDQEGVPRAGIYSPGSIQKKIEQVTRLIDVELPAIGKSRGLP
jgi:hypothetical protein